MRPCSPRRPRSFTGRYSPHRLNEPLSYIISEPFAFVKCKLWIRKRGQTCADLLPVYSRQSRYGSPPLLVDTAGGDPDGLRLPDALHVAVLVHDLAGRNCDPWFGRSEGSMALGAILLRRWILLCSVLSHGDLLVMEKDFQTFKMVVATSVGSTPFGIYGSGAVSASHLSSYVLLPDSIIPQKESRKELITISLLPSREA